LAVPISSRNSSGVDASHTDPKNELESAESALCGAFGPESGFDLVQIRDYAEKGNAFGQWVLGTDYECGDGVGKDYKQAAAWFQKAAEQGDYDSQLSLSRLYTGRGVPQSYEEAYFWLNLACANAPEDARRVAESLRDKAMSQLSAEQVADAQARANKWFAERRAH